MPIMYENCTDCCPPPATVIKLCDAEYPVPSRLYLTLTVALTSPNGCDCDTFEIVLSLDHTTGALPNPFSLFGGFDNWYGETDLAICSGAIGIDLKCSDPGEISFRVLLGPSCNFDGSLSWALSMAVARFRFGSRDWPSYTNSEPIPGTMTLSPVYIEFRDVAVTDCRAANKAAVGGVSTFVNLIYTCNGFGGSFPDPSCDFDNYVCVNAVVTE